MKTDTMPPDTKFTKADFANTYQYAMKDDILIHLFQPRMKVKYKYDPMFRHIVVPWKLHARILTNYHESLPGAWCHSGFGHYFNQYIKNITGDTCILIFRMWHGGVLDNYYGVIKGNRLLVFLFQIIIDVLVADSCQVALEILLLLGY